MMFRRLGLPRACSALASVHLAPIEHVVRNAFCRSSGRIVCRFGNEREQKKPKHFTFQSIRPIRKFSRTQNQITPQSDVVDECRARAHAQRNGQVGHKRMDKKRNENVKQK